MKTILDLSNVKAYQYFMESENYCNISFPVYINFKKILEYVESTVGNNELKTILKDSKKKPSAFENVNHTILMKKDGMYAYRLTSSLRHPKIFIKEFGDFLMPCHQHCLSVYILVQR